MRNKQEKPLPKILPGSVQAHMVKCGRPGCRCERGELHGPYYYHYWRELGGQRKRYVKPSELASVRALCAAGQEERRRRIRIRKLLHETSMETWRSTNALLKQIDQIRARMAAKEFYPDDNA